MDLVECPSCGREDVPVTEIEAHFETCFEQMTAGTTEYRKQQKQQHHRGGRSSAGSQAGTGAGAAVGGNGSISSSTSSSGGGKRGVSINHLIKFTRASQDTGNSMYAPPQRTVSGAAMIASRQRTSHHIATGGGCLSSPFFSLISFCFYLSFFLKVLVELFGLHSRFCLLSFFVFFLVGADI